MNFSLPHRLDLTTGVRYDDFGQFGARYSPRSRLAWKATSQLSLALSGGSGYLAPRPILERICCGAKVQMPCLACYVQRRVNRRNYLR